MKYKDGEKTIVVPSDATAVNLVPGNNADLKPGTKIFVPRWEKKADGAGKQRWWSWAVTGSATDVAQILLRWGKADDVDVG